MVTREPMLDEYRVLAPGGVRSAYHLVPRTVSRAQADAVQAGLSYVAAIGRYPADLLMTTDPTPVVSERFVSVLDESRVSGWAVEPVTVEDRDGHPLSGFFVFNVLGRTSSLDLSRTELLRHPEDDSIILERGVFFDPSGWDGSDVFSPPHGPICVTARLARVLAAAGLTNVTLIAPELYVIARWATVPPHKARSHEPL